MSVIIVSDLHAGHDNCYPELRTTDQPTTLERPRQQLATLATAISNTGLSPPSSRVLLCAGDLSCTNHSKELSMAASFLEHLAAALEIPPAFRFLVPGNHDLDWNLTKLAEEQTDPWYDRYKQTKFAEAIAEHAPSFSFCHGGCPTLHAIPSDAELIMLDSPWDDRHNRHPHFGRLGTSQLSKLQDLLQNSRHRAARIALLHHHIAPHGRSESDPDFSLLHDARDLIDLLRDFGVSFVIHGHQHSFGFDQLGPAPSQLAILCAGSTTATHLPAQVPNSFHVANFDTLTHTHTQGAIITRIFSTPDGWTRPDRRRHRLSSRAPFGHEANRATIDNWLNTVVSQARSSGYVRLDDFLRTQAAGQYFDPNEFKRELTRHIQTNSLSDLELHFNDTRDCWQLDSTT